MSIGKPRNSETPLRNKLENNVSPVVKQPATIVKGISLKTLSEEKHLPADFLQELGITESKNKGILTVNIPYFSEDGVEIALRYRLALSGNCRFKWRKGSHPLPYGLNKLSMAQKAGWILVVEGESDCWTAWYHGIPAIGAPGKSTWRKEWGDYLQELDVYLWQEPEAHDFTLRVLESIPNLRYIPAPEGIKDISEAHIQGIKIPKWLEELKSKAEYGQNLKEKIISTQLTEACEAAKPVIEADDPLVIIEKTIREMGYGGDIKPVMITYLAATSRLLAVKQGSMLVHLILLGPPSAGKSYTVSQVLKLLPSEAYHIIEVKSRLLCEIC